MPNNKNMLNDETLEKVTGGVIPKEIEGSLLDFARKWAYRLCEVEDRRTLRTRTSVELHVKQSWSCKVPELNIYQFLGYMHADDVTQEEFVDFVWEHRNEIPCVG